MPKLNDRIPKYRLHRHSGQAIVTLNGTDHYLGPHGALASRVEYDRLIAEWLVQGRQSSVPPQAQPQYLINQLILEFWEHAQGYYRKPDGTPTTELENYRQVLRPLRKLYGHKPATEFGPKALKVARERLIQIGWARKHINRGIKRLCHVFRWAAAEEKLPAAIYDQLRLVPALKRGRTEARETPKVRPVPEDYIKAVTPFVSRQVAALIQLQLLTGARAGELVILRGIDLHTQEKIWTAHHEEHKTAYRELPKTLYFGPQAQAILGEFLQDRPLDAYLFDPREAEAERRARQHAARKTPLSCGNRPGTNCQEAPKRQPAEHYTVASYRRAIERGCDLPYPPPAELARRKAPAAKGMRWETKVEWQTRLGPEAWADLAKWQKAHRWHPHQLRHNAGTFLRKEFGVEVARVILGQRSLPVTEIYAEVDEAKARSVIGKVG